MKLNLDAEPMYMGTALTLAFKIMAANPNQPIGTGGAIYEQEGGVKFSLIRNQDSYTVRQMIQ